MMNYKVLIVLFIVITLMLGIAYADSSAGGAGGIRYRQQKLMDPYSRIKYFGFNYTKPVFGFGKKDAPQGGMAKGNYGAKGVGGNRNIIYNSFISQGRNPGRISHFDSGWKGSKNIDKVINLRSALDINKDGKTYEMSGVARLISQEYEQNARLPFSEIYINVGHAPPSNKTEMMGAWLVDEDTGYQLHLGNFFVNFRGTGSMVYRVYQFFGPYDTLLLTREPVPATDPFPHELVLVGDLK